MNISTYSSDQRKWRLVEYNGLVWAECRLIGNQYLGFYFDLLNSKEELESLEKMVVGWRRAFDATQATAVIEPPTPEEQRDDYLEAQGERDVEAAADDSVYVPGQENDSREEDDEVTF